MSTTDYYAQIPNTHTLNGYNARAIEKDGEQLYVIRLLDLDGTTTNYVLTQQGMEHMRQENERAMLSAMVGPRN
ncbi:MULTISPECIES: hypothetical protein [unclassified Mycolicibacterium]|uniref:hypothetical protein n=1 Tax=unclassified Mycolicibacterium TaxID=2636767 RepID=UPI0012DCCECE|nr:MULTISPECIES: hypothetical protein [unclassified Mycolicibacterium]MUL85229.1 hypothetical protein [Mycolicibacterium sp. CBMA 329]MUL91196.1 hypothetical protein [Mycolicibacterium sp. CBMA 331]MUL98135.1 hypothetical protein [Mycolicibacterium sp. CBMA 334]MUM25765.1 hypothetical protein [Mycolicibacterium sp. CBMA 295]MUM40955.1 hypothetical protein [Mycolicibacterium sp. CBMA 247]